MVMGTVVSGGCLPCNKKCSRETGTIKVSFDENEREYLQFLIQTANGFATFICVPVAALSYFSIPPLCQRNICLVLKDKTRRMMPFSLH